MSEKLIIIGGGIIGGSILYNLYKDGYKGKTIVIEKLDALGQGSTSLCAGGVRNIWSTVVNMKLTSYSLKKFNEYDKELGMAVGFDQRGYLFNYYEDDFKKISAFKPNWDRSGVRTELLKPEEIEKMITGLHTGLDHLDNETVDMLELKPIAGGLLGLDCGLINSTAVAVGYFEMVNKMHKDKVELKLNTEVKSLIIEGETVKGIITEKGEKIYSDIVIVAAGAWTKKLLEDSGIPEEQNIPMYPLKRMLFVVQPPKSNLNIEKIPFTIIDKGIYFRPEAGNLLVGKAKEDEKPGFDTAPERSYYEDFINLYMQSRLEGSEYCRIESMWGGLYAHNYKDKNGIVSFHPDYKGLFIAAAFSGHGVMEAPGIGKSVSEMILNGNPVTIPEVKALDFKRFRENKLIVETIVI